MHPVLFTIPLFGGLAIHTYGVLVALGFLVGMWWVTAEAKRVGENPERAADLVFYIIIAAIVGSRILYVAVAMREEFLADPLSFFTIWRGGLVFYGGLIAAVLVSVWYTHRHRRSFWKYADLFAPGIAVGHAFGRLGCLAAGCCYGRPVGGVHWWTMVFPPIPGGAPLPGVPLYPTQLMEAAAELGIFFGLLALRHRLRSPGRLFAIYLAAYAVVRFCLEYWRGDPERGALIPGVLSTSQGVAIAAFAGAIAIWLTRKRAIV